MPTVDLSNIIPDGCEAIVDASESNDPSFALNALSIPVLDSILCTASWFILEPKALFTKPPTTLRPAPATAPQGPGMAEAILPKPPMALPAPDSSPPEIALPAIPPTRFPAAPSNPPAVVPLANSLPKLPRPAPLPRLFRNPPIP